MKFYESHYEEYLYSVKKYNIHDEINTFIKQLPDKSDEMGNLIVYGPSGVGKYSQVLHILKKYSSSNFKYDKKITIQTDKQNYTYHISDIHYEIDMSLLGCNSKILWNDIFLQIFDIISVKTEKIGFIVCKNFHMIHGELLDIFYSYIQQFSECCKAKSAFGANIIVHFILITENLSFIPNNILNACHVVNIGRPTKEKYEKIISHQENIGISRTFKKEIGESIPLSIMDMIECNEIINIKELYAFSNLQNNQNDIPKDIFNTVCNNILKEILNVKKTSFSSFRDVIYDILIYNLEAVECLWYILYYLIHFYSCKEGTTKAEILSYDKSKKGHKASLSRKDISDIITKSYSFLKYYNNNYRPIYHLESMLFYIIVKLYDYELPESSGNIGIRISM